MSWTKPEATEIKMDAEISSYQDDSYDPLKDGPLFVKSEQPAETELDVVITRAWRRPPRAKRSSCDARCA